MRRCPARVRCPSLCEGWEFQLSQPSKLVLPCLGVSVVRCVFSLPPSLFFSALTLYPHLFPEAPCAVLQANVC